jgi:hypothetical protein
MAGWIVRGGFRGCAGPNVPSAPADDDRATGVRGLQNTVRTNIKIGDDYVG